MKTCKIFSFDYIERNKRNKMSLSEQGAKPTGLIGMIIGKLMNRFHTPFYLKFIHQIKLKPGNIVIDIGCGGGKFLNSFSSHYPAALFLGLDHSKKMTELAQKTNRKPISENRLFLINGTVFTLPLKDKKASLITAFETIQFWPDIIESLKEINRVLDGKLIIINRYPQEGTTWWEKAKIKNEKEYYSILSQNGFKNIIINKTIKKGWIIVEGDNS